MSFTQFWVGMMMPPLLKWVNPYLKKFFNLTEINSETKIRVSVKKYPAYFGFLYGLWIIALLSTGFITLSWFIISNHVFFGLINMLGAWFIGGAIINFLFWQISTNKFRDYVEFRLIKSGWGYEIKQQIATLFKIGVIYYLLISPLIVYLFLW
jgi:hypothetical protein